MQKYNSGLKSIQDHAIIQLIFSLILMLKPHKITEISNVQNIKVTKYNQ